MASAATLSARDAPPFMQFYDPQQRASYGRRHENEASVQQYETILNPEIAARMPKILDDLEGISQMDAKRGADEAQQGFIAATLFKNKIWTENMKGWWLEACPSQRVTANVIQVEIRKTSPHLLQPMTILTAPHFLSFHRQRYLVSLSMYGLGAEHELQALRYPEGVEALKMQVDQWIPAEAATFKVSVAAAMSSAATFFYQLIQAMGDGGLADPDAALEESCNLFLAGQSEKGLGKAVQFVINNSALIRPNLPPLNRLLVSYFTPFQVTQGPGSAYWTEQSRVGNSAQGNLQAGTDSFYGMLGNSIKIVQDTVWNFQDSRHTHNVEFLRKLTTIGGFFSTGGWNAFQLHPNEFDPKTDLSVQCLDGEHGQWRIINHQTAIENSCRWDEKGELEKKYLGEAINKWKTIFRELGFRNMDNVTYFDPYIVMCKQGMEGKLSKTTDQKGWCIPKMVGQLDLRSRSTEWDDRHVASFMRMLQKHLTPKEFRTFQEVLDLRNLLYNPPEPIVDIAAIGGSTTLIAGSDAQVNWVTKGEWVDGVDAGGRPKAGADVKAAAHAKYLMDAIVQTLYFPIGKPASFKNSDKWINKKGNSLKLDRTCTVPTFVSHLYGFGSWAGIREMANARSQGFLIDANTNPEMFRDIELAERGWKVVQKLVDFVKATYTHLYVDAAHCPPWLKSEPKIKDLDETFAILSLLDTESFLPTFLPRGDVPRQPQMDPAAHLPEQERKSTFKMFFGVDWDGGNPTYVALELLVSSVFEKDYFQAGLFTSKWDHANFKEIWDQNRVRGQVPSETILDYFVQKILPESDVNMKEMFTANFFNYMLTAFNSSAVSPISKNTLKLFREKLIYETNGKSVANANAKGTQAVIPGIATAVSTSISLSKHYWHALDFSDTMFTIPADPRDPVKPLFYGVPTGGAAVSQRPRDLARGQRPDDAEGEERLQRMVQQESKESLAKVKGLLDPFGVDETDPFLKFCRPFMHLMKDPLGPFFLHSFIGGQQVDDYYLQKRLQIMSDKKYNSLQRLSLLCFYFTKLNKNAALDMEEQGVLSFIFDILFLRPYVKMMNNAVILYVAGQVGRLLYGMESVTQGQDAVLKNMHANFTMYIGVVITEPLNVMLLPDMFCSKYVSGFNCEFFGPKDKITSGKSLYAIDAGMNWSMEAMGNSMSISGKHDVKRFPFPKFKEPGQDRFMNPKAPFYDGCVYYAVVHGFNRLNASDTYQPQSFWQMKLSQYQNVLCRKEPHRWYNHQHQDFTHEVIGNWWLHNWGPEELSCALKGGGVDYFAK